MNTRSEGKRYILHVAGRGFYRGVTGSSPVYSYTKNVGEAKRYVTLTELGAISVALEAYVGLGTVTPRQIKITVELLP
jgi:hypothetical protein